MNRLENRFKDYLEKHDNSKLYDIFQRIVTYPEKKISEALDKDTTDHYLQTLFLGLMVSLDI